MFSPPCLLLGLAQIWRSRERAPLVDNIPGTTRWETGCPPREYPACNFPVSLVITADCRDTGLGVQLLLLILSSRSSEDCSVQKGQKQSVH
ncbi:hypothetical protein FKM82_018947 [Ascaphus truei]